MSFSFLLGSRYIRVKQKNHYISFISLTSMIGISLGVTVLITVLSVMNGFSKEIRKQMLSVAPHVTLNSYLEPLIDWQPVLDDILKTEKIVGATPFIIKHGMLAYTDYVQPVLIRGIAPEKINNVYPFEKTMVKGNLKNLTKGSFGVLIGKELARSLNLKMGDKATLIVPDANVTPAGVIPRMKRLTVVGIYDTGTPYDNRHAFINLSDANVIYRMNNEISGIQIKLEDELYSDQISNLLYEKFNFKYSVSSWTQEFANFFEAIKMEKTVMWCILLLIIAVAAFNLVSSLVMMVTSKRTDIAILRTMGASRKQIMYIFIYQGVIIGFIGTFIGLLGGLLLAYNVTDIVNFIQNLFGVHFISEQVYYIGYVPSDIQKMDVILISAFSLIMSFFATIYPSYKATKILPAEALRYE